MDKMRVGDILVCKYSTTMDCLLYGLEYGESYEIVDIHHDEMAILIDNITMWFTKSGSVYKSYPYYGDYFCNNIKEIRKIKLEVLNGTS